MNFKVTLAQRLLARVKRKLQLEPPVPPFNFPIQVGDPVLRLQAINVAPEEMNSEKLKRLLTAMHFVLSKTKGVGISAPQVGVPLRVFMTELTSEECAKHAPPTWQQANLQPWPLKVFINPELEVLDNETADSPEGCASVLGFMASVPRFRKVKVTGLNEEGQPCSWEALDFAACVVQHEMDHLKGALYIDRMDSRTFESCNWRQAHRIEKLL